MSEEQKQVFDELKRYVTFEWSALFSPNIDIIPDEESISEEPDKD